MCFDRLSGMKKWIPYIFLVISNFAWAQIVPVQNSVLSEGNWYKFSLSEPGIYKITGAELASWGVNLSNIDAGGLQLYGVPEGIIPQSNDVDFPIDLKELAILTSSSNNFTANDYILFYSTGTHRFELDPDKETFFLQKNIYSDQSYYYLRVDGNNGKRVVSTSNLWDGTNLITDYENGGWVEEDLENLRSSGRQWFGQKFSGTNLSQKYPFPNLSPVSNSLIKVIPVLVGKSYKNASFDIEIDGFTLGNIPFDAVSDYYYDIKGRIVTDTLEINAGLATNPLEVNIIFNENTTAKLSQGYMDKLVVHSVDGLSADTDQYSFRSLKALQNPVSNYQLQAYNYDQLWDVSDPFNPKSQNYNINGEFMEFGNTGNEVREYVVFRSNVSLNKVEYIENLSNQDIKGLPIADFIIITAPEFESQAEALANLRRSHDGLQVNVVKTSEVYNEFSAGRPDPTAIRNYVRYMYWRSDGVNVLENLLLFGKGTFDYKDILKQGRNFVPIYQSRNSLNPLKTYGSDDYYTFLEPGEGEWSEFDNHDSEIGVGRLPVKSEQEAWNVVNKLKLYASYPKTLDSWRKKVIFVADDGDDNTHHINSEQLAELVDTLYSGIHPEKVYLDMFQQNLTGGGEKSKEMEAALKESINNGGLVINYTGHGGYQGWMQESVLDKIDADNWRNLDNLPLFVTATCEFGQHDSPLIISVGEYTLVNPDGGGIGLITSSRPVYARTNFKLNKAFYKEVFKLENGEYHRLGEVFRRTKNSSMEGVNNRNFALLGDPSMKLAYPENRIAITSVNEMNPDETSISALSNVSVTGEIRGVDNQVIDNFNGEVNIRIFDKPLVRKTLGDENSPFPYENWEVLLFNGNATVQNGRFNLEFIVPKNILYQEGTGKVLMFAISDDQSMDASGSEFKLKIGGSSTVNIGDNNPPDISVYMDDRDFKWGGITGKNPYILVDLFDESGIATTGLGVGHDLKAILDDSITFELNHFYTAKKDTYQEGVVYMQLKNLAVGRHHIKVEAWDILNNGNSAELEFVVSNDNQLKIFHVKSNPNPFRNSSVVSFRHSRTGENLKVMANLVSLTGQTVFSQEFYVRKADATVDLWEWNGENNDGQLVDKGMYIVLLTVQSEKDGTVDRSYGKIIYLE